MLSIAAVTRYHKLSSKQLPLIISQSWRSEVLRGGSCLRASQGQNQGVNTWSRLIQVIGRIHCHGARTKVPFLTGCESKTFSAPRGPCISSHMAPSITKASKSVLILLMLQIRCFKMLLLSLSDFPLPHLFAFKGSCDYTGHIR